MSKINDGYDIGDAQHSGPLGEETCLSFNVGIRATRTRRGHTRIAARYGCRRKYFLELRTGGTQMR